MYKTWIINSSSRQSVLFRSSDLGSKGFYLRLALRCCASRLFVIKKHEFVFYTILSHWCKNKECMRLHNELGGIIELMFLQHSSTIYIAIAQVKLDFYLNIYYYTNYTSHHRLLFPRHIGMLSKMNPNIVTIYICFFRWSKLNVGVFINYMYLAYCNTFNVNQCLYIKLNSCTNYCFVFLKNGKEYPKHCRIMQ